MKGLALLIALGLAIALAVLRGWVLSYLWFWFLVPLGVPSIGVAHAMGLSLLVSLFTAGASSKDADKKEGWDALRYVFTKLFGFGVTALMFLGFGYILSGIMS